MYYFISHIIDRDNSSDNNVQPARHSENGIIDASHPATIVRRAGKIEGAIEGVLNRWSAIEWTIFTRLFSVETGSQRSMTFEWLRAREREREKEFEKRQANRRITGF